MLAERAGSSLGGQGKAIPVEETAVQLSLPIATAENPKGATRTKTRDRLGVLRAGAPKAIGNAGTAAPATMEAPAHRRPRPAATGAMGMIRGREPAGGGGHNPPSRGAVYEQRTYGSVGAGAGNRPGYPTFEVLPRRWVVERTLAWITKCRRLDHDYERLTTTSVAMVKWSMVGLMTRRLAPTPGRQPWITE